MTEQQHIFEQIEDYIHERMSAEERLAFEKRMIADESLAASVNEARATDDAIHLACLADLKKTVGQDIKKIKHTPKWRNLTFWFVGSALLIVTSGGLFILTKKPEQKTDLITSGNKNLSSERNDAEKKEDSVEEEITKGKNKNNPSVLSPATQDGNDTLKNTDQSEAIIKNAPEEKGGHSTLNIGTTISPADRNKEENKNNASSTPDVKNNCNKEFDIKTESSCKHSENGSITVLADGGKDFTFQVDHETVNGARAVFHNLAPGEHKILVTYNKECTFTKTVHIEEKWCPMNQPFSFNPDYHEKWEMKYEEGAKGKLIIYDRSGREIYQNTFGTGNEHWNGTDMNGNAVPIGTYAAILYYSDGRKEKVDLTIVR